MKKVFLILLIFSFGLFQVEADSGISTVSWNSSGIPSATSCASTTSHGVMHLGVPNTTTYSATTSGSHGCTTHAYYASSNYTKTVTYNSNAITVCAVGERVVSISPDPCTSGTCTITCQKYDDTPPNLSEITLNVANEEYVPATDSKYLQFSFNPGGSPITDINAELELYNNPGGLKNLVFNAGNSFGIVENFSQVDGTDKLTWNNYRPYSFNIGIVCDEAGNCADLGASQNINVYAANISSSNSSLLGLGDLDSGTKVADGQINPLQLSLKDAYNNAIVPVRRSDNSVLRDVDVNINYNNSLYLDQYSQAGGGAVFVGGKQLGIGNSLNSRDLGILQNDSDGIYNLDVQVYTPTENAYDRAKGGFLLNSLTASTSDFGGSTSFASSRDFNFQPIYTATFVGTLKTMGFIEGILQTGTSIQTNKNGIIAPNADLALEFGSGVIVNAGDGVSSSFNLTSTGASITKGLIGNGYGNKTQYIPNFGVSSYDLETLLTQNSAISGLSSQYLSSHISYTLDGYIISYNGDIIGKNNYFGPLTHGNTRQVGIKILGKTYSEKEESILINQDRDINRVVGKITKSGVKKSIRSNAYDLIKNLGSIPATGKELLNGSVIYYKGDGIQISYKNDINSKYKASGKVILIEGGDLLIDEDISISGILGIIVLKNTNGKGGDILIDDDVLNIEASLYADKALLPYAIEKSRVLSQTDGIGYFKNQLFIYGSVFTNNTLGGSRTSPLICPYYLSSSCTMEEAQKYDLNFLRRFYVYDSSGGTNPDTIANGGKHYNGSTVYNSGLDYSDYPMIIKYNPLIQTTPPPLFSQ